MRSTVKGRSRSLNSPSTSTVSMSVVGMAALLLLTGRWSVFAQVSVRPVVSDNQVSLSEGYDTGGDLGYGFRGGETMELNLGEKIGGAGGGKRKVESGKSIKMEAEEESEVDMERPPLPTSLILRELGELKEAVKDLKALNSILYKQMKSFHKSCSASVAASASSSASSLSGSVHPDMIGSINNAIQSDALRLNPLPKSPCHEEFTYFQEYNGCYKLTAERVTWRVARERCLALNSDLASVESSRKQRFLIERAKSSPETRHCDFWVGLSRHSSSLSSWKWSLNDESPTFTNWNFNEPNNGKGNEHCVQMLWIFHWKWNDASCNYGNACYICQANSYA